MNHHSDTVSMTSKEKDQTGKSAVRENLEAILVAVLLALFIRTFVVQAFKIPSGSMKNTLLIGDQILVSKFAYGFKVPFRLLDEPLLKFNEPQRGDIVVFKFPEDPDKDFIKRVIGVAGDIIEIKEKKVFVNGEPAEYTQAIFLEERIIPPNRSPRDTLPQIVVPPNSIFVMGDNRDHSYDSRFWGFVNVEAVRGKAFMIYWSWNKDTSSPRLERMGDILR